MGGRSPGAACRRISTSPSRRARSRIASPPMAARPIDLLLDTVEVDRALVPGPCHACRRRRTGAHRQSQRPWSGSARSPKPISATACSMRRPSWPRTAASASARIRLIRISAADELRTLEYGQRLLHRRAQRAGRGDALDRAAPVRGSRWPAVARRWAARGRSAISAPGERADFVVLDRHHPALAAAEGDSLLDAWLFAADNAAIKTVYCDGVPVVQDGRHVARDRAHPALPQGFG